MNPSRGRLCVLAVALSFASVALAQEEDRRGSRYRNTRNRADAFRQPPKLTTGNNANPPPLGTYQSKNRSGFSTRVDQLRALRPDTKFNLLTPSRRLTSPSPVKRMLDRRNMLAARSPMGRMASSQLGRLDYVPDESGVLAGDVARLQPAPGALIKVPATMQPDNGSYQQFLEARLAKQADEYFQKGLDAFRRNDMLTAGQHFETVRLIERDRCRASLGLMFTKFQMGDLMRATIELLTALDRANTAHDLYMDKAAMYEQAGYQRSLDAVTIWAQRSPDRPEPSLMLAYFAWINRDLATARESIDLVEKKMPNTWNAPPIQRFREFILKGPPPAPETPR